MRSIVLIVPAAIGLALPVLALRGIYGLAGWWGVGGLLLAFAVFWLFIAGGARQEIDRL